MALRPDPLDKPPENDLPYVGSGCLGLILLPLGGLIARAAWAGEPFYGNVGRVMSLQSKLVTAAVFALAGLILLVIAVRGLRRLGRRR